MSNLKVHDLSYTFVPKERRILCRRIAALKEHNRLCRQAQQSEATYAHRVMRSKTYWVSTVTEAK